jgi:hypothetical protein
MKGIKKKLLMTLWFLGDSGAYQQSYSQYYTDGSKEDLSWNEVFESYKTSSGIEYQVKYMETVNDVSFCYIFDILLVVYTGYGHLYFSTGKAQFFFNDGNSSRARKFSLDKFC